MAVEAGTRLGPYEVLAPLGAGGMGEVYRARDPRLGREVALKVLRSEKSADPERLRRFEREAKAVASLNHPHILTVFDVGTDGGTPYVVTELLEGETLRAVLSRRAPTQRQLVSFAVQIAQGLAAAHQKGVVHRDLKPENLFVTTDGRVKILDFGLAKLVEVSDSAGATESTADASTPSGVVMGTVSYMSPEQVRALPLDHRTDIFSFGVVLYEVLGGRHPFRRETGPATLEAIVHETQPDLALLGRGVSPALAGIVGRCLEKQREDRFHSAHDLALALESVLQAPSGPARLEEVEERSPYPGLRSFTEKDAGVFFGREAEVAALWDRIRERRLLAVIGPSGAGKTSFVRAGVVPARPEGWVALVCTPGTQPFRGLGRVIGPELSGDSEGLGMLADVEDPDTAVELVSRWRQREAEALLVVDQAEELFTLSPPGVQDRFAGLLGRLTDEAEVHVVLSLRDDFLVRCSGLMPFEPVLRDLTALQPLESVALRRAVVEPASKRGYRFEETALVDEMVQAVEGARGALPLLAFAVSRLWETRDRERKVLTRSAYEEIGGVAGALAQHAEQTLERIGRSREPIVREIFRNLVTAQGTRAVGDREELLSVFPERGVAEEVLQQLVDARLLTSYEPGAAESGHPERDTAEERARNLRSGTSGPLSTERHRIEIVHESLLSAWPRLVRWQAQDEEGAVLRDQLRQAAHLWDEKGRDPDLLWSGTSYREYDLWRERYPGKLTAVEQDFSRAMVDQVRRRRRIRRVVVAAAFVALAGVAAAIAVSRHQVVASRDQARAESVRAEASALLAQAQLRLEEDPTEALAYATASLELSDNPTARLFVVKILAEGPPVREADTRGGDYRVTAFSPDGTWLAVAGHTERVLIWHVDGTGPVVLEGHEGGTESNGAQWASNDLLVTGASNRVVAWQLPEATKLRTIEFGAPTNWHVGPERLLAETRPAAPSIEASTPAGQPSGNSILRSWSLPYGEAELLGTVDRERLGALDTLFEPGGRGWLYTKGSELYRLPLPLGESPAPRLVGRHESTAHLAYFLDRPDRITTLDDAGNVRIYSDSAKGLVLESSIARPRTAPRKRLYPNPTGRWLTRFAVQEQEVPVWSVARLPGARPLVLRRANSWYAPVPDFHPRGDWLASTTAAAAHVTLWPLTEASPSVVDGYSGVRRPLAFSADGRWLATSWSDNRLRLWPLPPSEAVGVQTFEARGLTCRIAFDPHGRYVFHTGLSRKPWIVPLDGSAPRSLEGFVESTLLDAAAVSPSGGRVASAWGGGEGGRKLLRVWDLESGEVRVFDLPGAVEESTQEPFTGSSSAVYGGAVTQATFTGESTLYTAGTKGVLRWNLDDGTHETLVPVDPGDTAIMAVSSDGRTALTLAKTLDDWTGCTTPLLHELSKDTTRSLPEFGDCVRYIAIDPSGRVAATGDHRGLVRVGRIGGAAPHVLAGHEGTVQRVAISPDLQWVASSGDDNTLRLWPMPDLDATPLHALPHDELIAKLESLTNLRAVRDPDAPAGWSIELGPFPGWRDVPTW